MARRALTRDRILERALRLASAEGLEGLSLARLADDVGMSKSGLFAHFRSKEELELAVIATAVERFTEIVFRPALAEPRGVPRLRALFERWFAWEAHESVPGGCVFVQLGTELHERRGPTRDALVNAQRDWLRTMEKAARLAVDEGHFSSDLDPALFAFRMHGILYSYYFRFRLLGDDEARRLATAAFEDLIASSRRPAGATTATRPR